MLESKRLKRILAVSVLTAVVLFAAAMMRPNDAYQQLRTWFFEPVQGVVLNIKPPIDAKPVLIDYAYEIDGKKFFGNRLRLIRSEMDWEFNNELGNLKKGDPITVYFDPHDQQSSVLFRGADFTTTFMMTWCSMAMIGWCVMMIQLIAGLRTKEKISNQLVDRIVINEDATVARLRIVPGNMTPLSAGVICGVAVSLLAFCVLLVSGWLSMGTPGAICLSLLLGISAGTFDYFYALKGNERGRWDLIVDQANGRIQLPAIGAWGQPCEIDIDDVTALSCDQLFPSDENEMFPTLALYVSFQTHGIAHQQKAAVGTNRNELEALADWIRAAIALPEPTPEATVLLVDESPLNEPLTIQHGS